MRDPRHAPILPEHQLIAHASALCTPPHSGRLRELAALAVAPLSALNCDDANGSSLRGRG